MAVVSLAELSKSGALIGVDPGDRRIGVAACDAARMMVFPVETIKRGDKLQPVLARLFALYDERSAAGFVIGLPLNMDGSKGPRTQSAEAFVRNLLKFCDVPCAFQDERLSSAEADDRLQGEAAKHGRDAAAAAIILEDALAAMRLGA